MRIIACSGSNFQAREISVCFRRPSQLYCTYAVITIFSRSCDSMSAQNRDHSAWHGPRDYAQDPTREKLKEIPHLVWNERFSELVLEPEQSHYKEKKDLKKHILATTHMRVAERNFANDPFFAYDLMISKSMSGLMRHDHSNTTSSFSTRARYWDREYNLVGLSAGDPAAQGMVPGCIPVHEIGFFKYRAGRLIMSDPDLLEFILDTNDKQRFHYEARDTPPNSVQTEGPLMWFICANQGHSRSMQSNMISAAGSGRRVTGDEDDLPPVLYHATTRIAAAQILREGYLKSEDRVDIHFCMRPPHDPLMKTASTQALQKPIWIFVDIERLLRAGVPLYITKNDVALVRTENGKLARWFIKEVIEHKTEWSLLNSMHGTQHEDVRMCLDAKLAREPDFREANKPESIGMPEDIKDIRVDNEARPSRSDLDRLHDRTKDFSVEFTAGSKPSEKPGSTLPPISEAAPVAQPAGGTQYFDMRTPIGSPRSYGPSTPYVESEGTSSAATSSQTPLPQPVPTADPVIKEEIDWDEDVPGLNEVPAIASVETSSVDSGSYIKIEDLESLQSFSNAPSVIEVDDFTDDDIVQLSSEKNLPAVASEVPASTSKEELPAALKPYSKQLREGWVPVWQGNHVIGIYKDGEFQDTSEDKATAVQKKRHSADDDSSSENKKKKRDKDTRQSGGASSSNASASDKVPEPLLPWKPPWGWKPNRVATFNNSNRRMGDSWS